MLQSVITCVYQYALGIDVKTCKRKSLDDDEEEGEESKQTV